MRTARADGAGVRVACRAAVGVRVEHADDAGNAGLGRPAAGVARERDRSRGRAVVGAVAGDDLVAARVPAGEFDRVLVRFGAAVREERHRQVPRGHIGEQPRELRACLVCHRRTDSGQLVGLLLDRRDDLGVLVPDRDVDELGGEVAALASCDREWGDLVLHRP